MPLKYVKVKSTVCEWARSCGSLWDLESFNYINGYSQGCSSSRLQGQFWSLSDFPRAVVLKVWSLDQQHKHLLELVRNANLGVHPSPTTSETLGMDPAICILTSPPDASDARPCVRTTGLEGVLGGLLFSLDTCRFSYKIGLLVTLLLSEPAVMPAQSQCMNQWMNC